MTSKTPLILNEKLFQVTEESSDGKIKAKCCLCPASKSFLSGSKKATSNFLLQLGRKHPAEATDIKKSKRARKDDSQEIPKTMQKTLPYLDFVTQKRLPKMLLQKQLLI